MATIATISYVGQANTQNGSAGTTLAINVPSGTVDNDLMIMFVASSVGTSNWTTPTGWLLGDTGLGRGIFYRLASAEPASYTVTAPESATLQGYIVTYRNAIWGGISARGSLATPSVAPTVTTTVVNSMLLTFYSSTLGSITFTTPSTWTALVSNSDASAPSSAIFNKLQTTIGSVGTVSSTPSSSTGIGYQLYLSPIVIPGSGFKKDDHVFGSIDLDDQYITDSWLIDKYVGNALFTWGDATDGVLGDGGATNRSSPIQIGNLINWKQIGVGSNFMVGVRTDGTLWSWGRNSLGQLGLRDVTNRSSPVQVGSLTNWKQVSTSFDFALSITTGGQLYAWGQNGDGQLGLGNTTSRSSPTIVGSLTNWNQVSGGDRHTLAITTDGRLWSWGAGSNGALGSGNVTSRQSPVAVGALTNWKQVAAGIDCSLAIKTDGSLWAWGNNGNGELGLNDRTNRSSPVQVGLLTNWKQVAVVSSGNSNHCAAIKTDGTLWTWGQNTNFGQLGLGDNNNRSSPVQVGSLTNWKQVACGNRSTMAIKTDGTLWAWGHNENNGGLGNGETNTTYSSPIQIGSLTNWKQVGKNGDGGAAVTFSEIT